MARMAERKLVSFDWAVKRLLRSKANFEVLEGFLSELLFDDIKILEILESESNKENDDGKYNRVDIKVKNGKGEIVLIEVQFNNERDFFHRILYATSKTICEHLDEGEAFSKIAKVISVNILYFDLGEGSDYIYRGKTVFNSFHEKGILKLNQEQQNMFQKEYPSDIFPEYYIIKVNNFNDVAKNTLDEWIYLFKNSAIKSDFKARGIKKAGRVLDKMRMSKEERLAYENYMYHKVAALGDFETAIMDGRNQGIKEGRNAERKLQEAKIKKIEDSHRKELKRNDQKYKRELKEKDNKLKQIALLLLANGYTKEQIFLETGIEL